VEEIRGMELVIALLILIIPFPSAAAVTYLWRLYLSDSRRPRSWMLWTFALGSTGILIVGIYFALVIVWRMISLDVPPETRIVSGLAIAALLSIPIAFAAQIEWRRRIARDPSIASNPPDDDLNAAEAHPKEAPAHERSRSTPEP
jgi:hypothetical protein